MIRAAAALVLVACGGAAAPARIPIVAVRASEPPRVAPGASAELSVPVAVREGFHVQSHTPYPEFLIATVLHLDAAPGVFVGEPLYPPGEPYRIAGSDETMSVYGGTFVVRVPVTIDGGAREGTVRLRGRLHYQACDDRSCLTPTDAAVEVTLRIVRR